MQTWARSRFLESLQPVEERVFLQDPLLKAKQMGIPLWSTTLDLLGMVELVVLDELEIGGSGVVDRSRLLKFQLLLLDVEASARGHRVVEPCGGKY